MKSAFERLILVGACVCAMCSSASAQIGANEFRALGVDQKRQLMRDTAIKQPENVGSGIFPLIEAGLGDADVAVRKDAIAALGRMALAARSNATHGKSNADADPAAYGPFTNAVLGLIDDSDAEVRSIAIPTAWLMFGMTPVLETHLVARFDQETNAIVRKGVLTTLINAGRYSPRVQQLFIDALGDHDPDVQGWGAKGVQKSRPRAALPLLVTGLSSSNSFVRARCVSALGAYGPDARPYLPALKNSALHESDPTVKAALQHALDQVGVDAGGHNPSHP